MKIAALVSQYLLGLAFVTFGLNGFLHFIPQPPPQPGLPGDFFRLMMQSHYMVPVFILQIAAGALFLANRFVPLALTLIAPVIVNILIYHATMDPKGIVAGVVVTALWFVLFARHRQAFAGVLRAKPTTA